MKNVLIMAALLSTFALTMCGGSDPARRDATTVGKEGWVFEGWACAPDSAKALAGLSPAQYCTDDDKKDHLYLKFSAAPKEGLETIAERQSTCREAARLQVAADALTKQIGEILEKASGVNNGRSTGFAIVSQVKGKIKGVGLYDCCSLDPKTGRCAKEGEAELWNECQCVGYIKYPGGQKAFVSSVEDMARAHESGN